MLQFRESMDHHSLDIYRGDQFIGFLQWHECRPPRIVLMDTTHGDKPTGIQSISINETRQCINEYEYRRQMLQLQERARHNGTIIMSPPPVTADHAT